MRAESDFWFYVVYVVSTIILYVTCVTTIFFIAHKSKGNGIKSFKNNHPEVFKGVTIVIGVFVILEVITEFIMAILWSWHVNDSLISFTVFLAGVVYYSPGIFSLYKIIKKIHLYRIGRYKDYSDVLFKCFTWTLSYFTYILLYAFFPAFVLAFAYPVRVITVFVFVATFMILSIVYITTYVSKGVTMKDCKGTKLGSIWINIMIWALMSINLLYFFFLIFALLYSLVIGRASVVSSAPLAILSLLPSILISITAWLLRSTMLTNNTESSDSEDEDTIRDRDLKHSKNKPDSTEQDSPECIQIDGDDGELNNTSELDSSM